MTDTTAAPKSPQEQVRDLQKLAVAGDLPAMLLTIGDLHERWDLLDAPLQSEVTKLEAIFLTLMNARAGNKAAGTKG